MGVCGCQPDTCYDRDLEIAKAVREREDYNGQHQAACLEIERLRPALTGMIDLYCDLVNSGDAGFWDPEKNPKVRAARAALLPTSQAGEEK